MCMHYIYPRAEHGMLPDIKQFSVTGVRRRMGCDVVTRRGTLIKSIFTWIDRLSRCIQSIYTTGQHPVARPFCFLICWSELQRRLGRDDVTDGSWYKGDTSTHAQRTDPNVGRGTWALSIHKYIDCICVKSLYVRTSTTRQLTWGKAVFFFFLNYCLLLACDGVWDVMFFTRRGT